MNEVVTVPVENLQMVRAKRIQTGFNFDQVCFIVSKYFFKILKLFNFFFSKKLKKDKCIMIESFEIHLSSARQNPVELTIEVCFF